jgi:hypothetical protein
MQQLLAFPVDLQRHYGDASDVPAGPIEIGDQTKLDRVSA